MQLPTTTRLAILALGYLAPQAAANAGYAGSCTHIGLFPPNGQYNYWSLTADCKDNSGGTHLDSQINLDSCFSNSGGNLVAQQNGDFSGSCSSITISGTVLKATCGNGAGGTTNTQIETNDYIGNADGALYCFNQGSLPTGQ